MRNRFASAATVALMISMLGFSMSACATQTAGAAPEGDENAEVGGKADEGGSAWAVGTGTSWSRALNAAHYVNVPSGAAEEGGVCSGSDTATVTLAEVLNEYYFASLDSANEGIVDETREISLKYKQGAGGAITYRITISTETTYVGLDASDPTIEETFESSLIIEFAANATAQNPVMATVFCAG